MSRLTPAQIEAGYVPAKVVTAIRSVRPLKAAIVAATADKWSKAMDSMIMYGSAVTEIDENDSKCVVELAATFPAWKLP